MRALLRSTWNRVRKVRDDLSWTLRKARIARRMEHVARLPERDTLRGTTLIFVPYASVIPMFSQACVVARTLKERGHRVIVARCFRLFDRCPAMDNDRLPYDADAGRKLESCLRCAGHSFSGLEAYGLESVDLRALVTPDMTATIDRALAQPPANLLDFEYDGLPFGKLSVMDVVLGRKISDFDAMQETERRAWLEYLRSCLLSHLLVDRLCREFGIGRVVHCNDYSLLLGARTAARKNGVPCYGLAFPGHRNVDLRRYLILSNVWKPSSFKLLANWPACRDACLDPDRVREVADDLLVRFGGIGSHIYSPGKTIEESDIRVRLGLSSDRKLLVAYTSSLDEVIASRMGVKALGIEIPDRPQPFPNQIEWLKALTQYVEASDDLQLVVRVHPREGVTKREATASQHLTWLREAFGGSYAHCRFVWPEERVSSYDLGEAADLVLVSWSTIGLEMARLAAPVLVAFNGADAAIPRDDFLEWGATPAAYFETLRVLLERPVGIDQVARAFRWYSLITLGTTVDLTDLVPQSNFTGLPAYRLPREAETIERILIGGRDVCEINVERLQQRQNPQNREREALELRRQLRRVVHFLMTGEDAADDRPLVVAPPRGNGKTAGAGESRERVISANGFLAEYHDGPRVFRRYSPMVVRLARLCSTEQKERSTAGALS